MSKNPPGSVGGVISNSIAIYKRGWLFQMSKVVSPHLWNTPRATFTNRRFSGIPFIIGERGDCLGWCSRVCCIFVENGVFFFQAGEIVPIAGAILVKFVSSFWCYFFHLESRLFVFSCFDKFSVHDSFGFQWGTIRTFSFGLVAGNFCGMMW